MEEQRPEPATDSAEARAHDLLGVGFVVGDGDRIRHVNPAAARIVGRTPDEVLAIGRLADLLHPEDRQRIDAAVADRREQGLRVPERFTARMRQPDGTEVPVELWVKAEVRGDEVRTYTLIHEIGELWALREGLTQLALTDPLTQLPNRLALEEHLGMALARLEREPERGVLVFVDLDGLKDINDRWGHAAGDRVLTELAVRLDAVARPGDTVARLAGDEFVALFPEVGDADIEALVSRVRRASAFSASLDGEEVPVTASVGGVAFGSEPTTPAAVLEAADREMYEEKRRRNR